MQLRHAPHAADIRSNDPFFAVRKIKLGLGKIYAKVLYLQNMMEQIATQDYC